MLVEVFSTYGEVANIYYPCDLKHSCRPLGMAFIRYTNPSSRDQALKEMHGTSFGIGREISVSISQEKAYYSQDETYYNPKKWDKGL
jgi:RNA recognition motif-containing protein